MKMTNNGPQVRASVRKTKQQYQSKAARLATAIGTDMRNRIRLNINTPIFPGYKITGALARKVVASPAGRVANGWQVIVKVDRTGKQKKYALIHETGGIIKAKNKPYLVFYIPGAGWRRAKQVRITKKEYFSRGVLETRRAWNRARLLAFWRV